MVKLIGALSRLSRNKILVAGDMILDTYTIGKARRISPEAPVAVVNVQREEHRPGGAGNVLLNLLAMGCEVAVLSRVGFDSSGDLLLKVLKEEGVDISGIIKEQGYPTAVKNRIIAENQQIVRVDNESVEPLQVQAEEAVIALIPQMMKDVKVVAISDYGKGFLTVKVLKALIEHAQKHKIPVLTDPKGLDFSKYKNSTLIKPNLSEAYAAAGVPSNGDIEEVAKKLLDKIDTDMLMVTRSEKGISLFNRKGERQDFPVRAKEVKDVTGAGDTVLAMIASAVASGLTMGEAAQLSNVAAGIAIERFGCARISLADLARELLHSDVTNKVFDVEHLFALEKAMEGRKYSTMKLSSKQGMSSALYNQIRNERQKGSELVIHITDNNPDPDFVNILSSLSEVNFVLLQQ